MITTLNKIRENSPCKNGWEKLLNSLDKTHADDDPLSLMHVLESNGIEDAIWCLCCFDYREYCLFLADVAESVISIYKDKYPNDDRVEKCIKAIRSYHAGDVDIEFLKAAYDAAYAAAYSADDVAYSAYAAAYSAYAAAYSAYAAAYAAAAADAADARKRKWKEIEVLFIKHFGE